jgi:uncharacterized protein
MDKTKILLAAMAPAGDQELTPVQVQKLLFLIEKNIGAEIGGTGFTFVPYDYGPFDSSIYDVLRTMEASGLASSTVTTKGWKKYSLTANGISAGEESLSQLPERVSDYIIKVSEFVRQASFSTLVSSIYNAYPEMKVNSVFRG